MPQRTRRQPIPSEAEPEKRREMTDGMTDGGATREAAQPSPWTAQTSQGAMPGSRCPTVVQAPRGPASGCAS